MAGGAFASAITHLPGVMRQVHAHNAPLPVDEGDIWRTASLLVAYFGEGAEYDATARIEDMIARRDKNGEAVWSRILEAIWELQRTKPRCGEAVN